MTFGFLEEYGGGEDALKNSLLAGDIAKLFWQLGGVNAAAYQGSNCCWWLVHQVLGHVNSIIRIAGHEVFLDNLASQLLHELWRNNYLKCRDDFIYLDVSGRCTETFAVEL